MSAIRDTIELQDNFSPTLRRVIDAVNYTVTAMEQLQGTMNNPVGSSALQAARVQVNNLNDAIRRAANVSANTQSQVNSLNNTVNQAAGNLSNAGNAAQQAGASLGNVGNAAQSAAERFAGVASGIGGLFVALGGYKILNTVKDAFSGAAKAAIEFESAITGVYKTVDGTNEQLDKISDEIKTMSLEIPSTTTEIAGVAEAAGQLGIATNDITGFTEVMIDLGESTNLASEEAASSLAKFANVTGMSASNYENLGSSIVALGNNFATTEADIVAMATRMASAGTLAGLTESDILGLATAVSSVGIEAEAGGTAVSKLLTSIQTAVETGNGSLEDFASVAGMSVEEFSDLFENRAVEAVTAFISGLNDVERNGKSAAVILDEMDIKEVRLSNTIKSLANNSDGMAEAVSTAGEAWFENTALTNETEKRYQTLESRLQMTKNATNNLKIAVGNALTPALGGLSDAAKNVLGDLTDFAEKNSALTAGIVGFTGTIGLAVGGLTTAIPTISMAITAVARLKDTLNITGKAMAVFAGKAGLVLAGVGAVVGIGSAIYTHFSKSKQAVEDYNGTMEQCRIEIENTQSALDNARGAYDENSDVVKTLTGNLDTLIAQYEKGGGRIQEIADKAHEAYESLQKLNDSTKQQTDSINASEIAGLKSISYLQKMSEKTNLTNSDLKMMGSYADYLNDTFECDIVVNYDTGDITGIDPQKNIDGIKEMSDIKRQKAAEEHLSDPEFITETYTLYKEWVDAKLEAEKTKNKHGVAGAKAYEYVDKKRKSDKDYYYTDYTSGTGYYDSNYFDFYRDMGLSRFNPSGEFNKFMVETDSDYAKVAEIENKLKESMNDNMKYFNDAEIDPNDWLSGVVTDSNKAVESMSTMADYVRAAKDSMATGVPIFGVQEFVDSLQGVEKATTSSEVLDEVMGQYADQISKVRDAYDEAYQAAKESFDGQFGLFDEASMKSEAYTSSTIANAQEALNSQLEYWKSYQSNIEYMSSITAESLGVTQTAYDSFMSYVRSGTPEAAGLIDDIVYNIEHGNSDVVTDVIETNQEVTTLRDQTAKDTADWTSGLSDKMSELVKTMAQDVEKMDLSPEAKSAAATTMNGYITMLSIKGQTAIDTAYDIAKEVTNALSSASGDINVGVSSSGTTGIELNAKGTTNAADIFIAGEEGPELIVGKQGSTVFPNSETNKIISALAGVNNAENSNSSGLYSVDSSRYMTVNNIENTKVFNSYGSAQGFDDSQIINSVDGLRNAFLQITDFSIFDRIIREYQKGSIENYDESMVYGDNISNFYDYAGDTIRNQSENIYNADYSSENQSITNYNREYNDLIKSENTKNDRFENRKNSTSEKNINLNLHIDVNGNLSDYSYSGTSEEEVVSIMADNLPAVLTNVLTREIFEEGEDSYEF